MSDPGRASMFGLWSAVNPTVAWLIARHPEVLVYTPREFQSGKRVRPRLDTTPATYDLADLIRETLRGRSLDVDWREDGGWQVKSEGKKA